MRGSMERMRSEPGVTLAGAAQGLAVMASVAAMLWVVPWIQNHARVLVAFMTFAWLGVATMGSQRLYPTLSPSDLDTIWRFQVRLLGMSTFMLLMQQVPAVRASHRGEVEFAVFAAAAALFVGAVMAFKPGMELLPTRVHQWIGCFGMIASLIFVSWL
jgi:hypothetical protein